MIERIESAEVGQGQFDRLRGGSWISRIADKLSARLAKIGHGGLGMLGVTPDDDDLRAARTHAAAPDNPSPVVPPMMTTTLSLSIS